MANTDKDILITPNRGSSNEPKIEFKGASSSVGPSTITATIYPTNNGTLSFDGTEGQLFSIANNLSTGSIFSVNPISGIPIIDVNADRTIALNPYGGNTGIGLTNPSYKLDVNGTARFSGQLTIPGDNSITFGPNSTWFSYLRIGGNGWTANSTTASVVTTNGNLHLDAADSNHGIYLNWYGGTDGTFFGNGAAGQIGRLDGSGNFSVSGTITGTQITSNIANGTAPFVVSSTTKVTNLNADYLDDQTGSYYLDYNNFTNTPTIGNGTITVQGNTGLTGSGSFTVNQTGTTTVTLNHADTSSQASVDNSNGTVIQDVTLDEYGHVTGLASTDLYTILKPSNNQNQVNINTPASSNGAWTTASSNDEWGNPKFDGAFNEYRYADAPAWVQYNIPAGMKSAWISQLTWSTGGYVDIHGIEIVSAVEKLVFLRRINTRQAVENSDEGVNHDGSTITFAASGLDDYSAIRFTVQSGRFHLTGLSFSTADNEGTEGVGMVHPAQISHQGSGSGLAAETATTLATIRTIWGQNFDGSANVSGTITGATDITATGEIQGTIFKDYNNISYYGDFGNTGTSIVTAGNIGAKTTSPLQALDVRGNFLLAADATTATHITQKPYTVNGGTLSWEGSAGQLFSITNNLTSGSIFSVNDVSGLPSIDVDANGTILFAPYGGNIGVGTLTPSQKLHVVGNSIITGSLGLGIDSAAAKLHTRVSTPTSIGSLPSGVTGILDSSSNNYLLFRNTADNGTYSGIAMQDNNVGGYVIFGNAGGGGDLLYVAGYGGGQLQYGTADSINPSTRTTVASWNSTGLQINNGDLRASIYRDSDDPSNRYLDPASTSYLNAIVTYGTLANYQNIGPNDDVRSGILAYDTTSMAANVGGQILLGYKYTSAGDYTEGAIIKTYKLNATSGDFSTGLKFQVRDSGEPLATRVWIDPTGNLYSDQSVRAPIFYDTDNTTYQFDGTGTTRLNTLRVFSNSAADWDAIEISTDGANGYIQGLGDETGLRIRSQYGNILLADDRGSVGIKNTSPLQALDVRGNFLLAADATTATHITQKPYTVNGGTLSWEGSEGQLFSIANNLTTGSIFSVNPISGIPIIDVNADRTIALNPYGGNTGIGLTNPSYKLDVNGTTRFSGASIFSSNISLSNGYIRAITNNQPAILSVASGTASSQASFAIQQETAEGWTGIFVDFEPNTGWGLYHDNPNNYFCITSEISTGSLRSFTVPSRSSGNRTAYEKIRFDQNNGNLIAGGEIQGTIFRDVISTSYYVDPASTSNIDYLQINDRLSLVKNRSHFTGVESTSSADGRSQIILNSYYSDVVIASQQINGNHGSTLSFTAVNPSDSGDYRKFVINQGNWTGSHLLRFGWADAAYTNPHTYVTGTFGSGYDVLGLDGVNRITYAFGEVRAPIFRDSNDPSNYYVDPNGTSRIDSIYIVGGVAGVSNSSAYHEAAIEVRERGFGGAQDDTWATAPRIGFHWSGRVASQIALSSNGRISILNNPGSGLEDFQCNNAYVNSVNLPNGFQISQGGSNYGVFNSWVRLDGIYGFYAPNHNGAHFYPNDASYGAWRISGSRNGWCGIHFDTGSTLMMNSSTVGFHREGAGWQMRWDAGTGYISKGNPGGGTDAIILDTVNYSSHAPTLTGTGASGTWGINITGNANTATNLSTTRTNWGSNGTITAVVGQLSWKNYGNSHTIFDASASTSPDGGSVNNTNPDYAWSATYPTLMGWNGANTFGVRVDSAKISDSTSGSSASCTGNAATATNISNSGTVTLASATESNSIYVSQPSYTTDQPVKLLNFDWYGNIWSLGNIRSGSTPSNGFGVYSSGTERARFTTSGLTVVGTTSSGVFTSTSDITKKTNIQNITNAVELTKQINGVRFDWKETEESSAGVIAQEVEEVLPEIVHTNDEGIKSVNYNGVVGLLVEAIKEQQKQIDELKKELKKLHK